MGNTNKKHIVHILYDPERYLQQHTDDDITLIKNFIIQKQNKNNLNYRDENGRTVLIYASLRGYTECVELLLRAGANPNIPEKYGWTALMYVSLRGYTECLQLLLQYKANPNLQTDYGWTALIWTVLKDKTECVRLLLKAGANPYNIYIPIIKNKILKRMRIVQILNNY